ncbi:MAG: FG-GAP-like repeat-containing protein [Alphaproteobacteria bacterium]
MTDKLENYQENNQTAYKGTASDDSITITDIDFSGSFVYTFEGNDTLVLENPKNKLEIYDGLGSDNYTLIEASSFDYNFDKDHILELDFKGFLDTSSLKFFKLEYNGSDQVLDIDMSLGTATYTTETTEDIDTFSGFIKIDISDFNEVQKDVTVTLKGNDKSNIFKIADFTKATLDGKGGTDVIEINVGKDLTIDLRDQSGTEGTFKNIEGIAITNYQPSNVTLKGDDNGNIFKSGEGNDTVYGYGGNDFIYVDSGTDIHYGGEGKDTAIFASAYRHHTIEIDPDDPTKVTVSGDGRPTNSNQGNIGNNEFNNFEFFQFADSKYELKSGKLTKVKQLFEDKSAGIIYDVGVTEILSSEKHDGYTYPDSASGEEVIFDPDFYGWSLVKIKQGDFNGDGLQDAVIFGTNNFNAQSVNNSEDLNAEQSEKLTILLNDGEGNFISGQHLINNKDYYRIDTYGGDVGDLNNDGIDDIVAVAKPDASWNQDDGIVILLSQPDGTFSDKTSSIVDERYTIERNGESLEVLQYGSRSLTIGDFDGDGWSDIYLENQSSKTTALLFNNEGNSFAEKESGEESYLPQYARYGFNHRAGDSVDFDLDGDLDIIVVPRVYELVKDSIDSGSNPSQYIDYAYGFILINDGTGDFKEESPILLPSGLEGSNNKVDDMVSGDLNGDGYPDVVIASGKFDPYYVDRDIQILINENGTKLNDETNTRIVNLRDDDSGHPEGAIYLVDYNDDGHLDIIDYQSNVKNGLAKDTLTPGSEFPYFHTGIAVFINDGEGYFTALEKDITKGIDNISFTEGGWAPVDFGSDYGVGFVFNMGIKQGFSPNTDYTDSNAIFGISTVRTTEKVYAGPDLKNPANDGYPGFDENYYLRVNSEAKISVDSGEYSSALEHYKAVGQSENLQTFAKGTKVHGYSGNDTIVLREGDETAYGYAGKDTIEGGAGNDIIDGGTGLDSAIYKDASSAYTLTANDDGTVSVVHSSPSEGFTDEGSDTLTSIEKMQFSDKTLSKTSLKYELSESIDTSENILSAHTEDVLSGTLNFNKGDNIIILDGQAKTYRGLRGDDTYFVSQLLPEKGKVSITDTEGANTIQIPSNTYIDKTLFTKNAARLTLENGREITISKADGFTYNVGGNKVDGTLGQDLTFSEFAKTFGITDVLNLSSSENGIYADMYII